jgi:hypothetical protein
MHFGERQKYDEKYEIHVNVNVMVKYIAVMLLVALMV